MLVLGEEILPCRCLVCASLLASCFSVCYRGIASAASLSHSRMNTYGVDVVVKLSEADPLHRQIHVERGQTCHARNTRNIHYLDPPTISRTQICSWWGLPIKVELPKEYARVVYGTGIPKMAVSSLETSAQDDHFIRINSYTLGNLIEVWSVRKYTNRRFIMSPSPTSPHIQTNLKIFLALLGFW